MGWALVNSVYRGDMSSIMFQSNQYPVTVEGARRLLHEVYRFLPNETPTPDHMGSDPVWHKMLITLDAGSFYGNNTLSSADFLLKNTWGELYFGSIDLAHTENNLLKCHEIARTVWSYLHESRASRLQYQVCRLGVSPDNMATRTIRDFIDRFRKGDTGITSGDIKKKENFERVVEKGDRPLLDLPPSPGRWD
jgi:hypothetical protein